MPNKTPWGRLPNPLPRFLPDQPLIVRPRPKRESPEERIAKLVAASSGRMPESDIARMREFMQNAGPRDYHPIGRDQRLASDGRDPPVFADGRGDGRAEDCCWYCGFESSRGRMIREHMISSSMRGSDDEANIVAACMSCNSNKSSMDVESFRRMLSAEFSVDAFVFAGESGLYVESGWQFEHVCTLSLRQRRKILATSLARKNPDPPPLPKRDPFQHNASKGLL